MSKTPLETAADIFAGLDQDPMEDTTPEAPAHEHKLDFKGRLTTAQEALKYITAGNATITLKSVKTGERFTYKVKIKDDNPGPRGAPFFVSLLVGPDNWTNYKYLGHFFTTQMVYWHGKKSKISETSPGAKAFAWFFRQLVRGQLPDTLEVWHEGSCGRCGRKLTVPESVASGFGPECIHKVGM